GRRAPDQARFLSRARTYAREDNQEAFVRASRAKYGKRSAAHRVPGRPDGPLRDLAGPLGTGFQSAAPRSTVCEGSPWRTSPNRPTPANSWSSRSSARVRPSGRGRSLAAAGRWWG